MEKVAIVILNWNGARMLQEYLPTVLRYSRDEATVYVADNASTDNSLELLRAEFPEARARSSVCPRTRRRRRTLRPPSIG